MELSRNHCQKYILDKNGEPISVADKMKYPTMGKAQLAADEQNLNLSRKEKIVPYRCVVCKNYHVGRNGEKLTQLDMEEIWKRTKPAEYRRPEVKVVDKIDLSKVGYGKTEIARRERKVKKKLERKRKKQNSN